MEIEMIVEKTGTGFSAYAKDYAAFTTGKDFKELQFNMLECMNLCLEVQGITISESDLKLSMDLPTFFALYNGVNASAISKRIGMSQSLLAQYIAGIKKPSTKQKERIFQGVQQLGRELSEVRF
ncbi:MAG: XRE family transcriptional regulator [Bacteroidota bacterium]